MAEAKTSARRVTAKIRRDRALALRTAGATFDQIARTPISADDPRPLYSSRQRAHEAVDKALEELAAETRGKTAQLRALELAKLDSMEVSLAPGTRPSRRVACEECGHTMWREPDQGAVNLRIRISERRSKFLGLDAGDETDERMVALLEEQVTMTRQALVIALGRAGVPPAMQREVLEHVADALREIDQEDDAG